jgi:hypothetical protein
MSNEKDAEVLGCQPYPKFNGPPPMFKAVIPYVSYAVPNVTDYKGFNSNTKFQTPFATINKMQGSEVISGVLIPIDLNNGCNEDSDGEVKCCVDGNNISCGAMSHGAPDKIIVSQNGLEIGNYPRPALEQKADGNLSFFPCYHTYNNPNTNSVYQGVFVFSINSSVNSRIGTNKNGVDIFLGKNYMAVLQDKNTYGECDLCVNAVSKDWPDSIYSQLTNPPSKCNLDKGIEIKMVKLVDESGSEILYPINKTNPTQEDLIKAPLRVNMYDIDEQKTLHPNNINYQYSSENGYLDRQLVSIRPVIPVIDSDGEAEFVTASTMDDDQDTTTNTCSNYFSDLQNGLVFIKPAGLRDRSKCFLDPKDSGKNLYTICSPQAEKEELNKIICPGLYQGPIDQSSTVPDKICIMSGGVWDFFSGRYNVNYKKNLNNDTKIVPRVSCTYLPGCVGLGEKTITNIGNAIWNSNADFNQNVKGKCDEVDYSYRFKIDDYRVNPDIVLEEGERQMLEQNLEVLKKSIQDTNKAQKEPSADTKMIYYITEQYLQKYDANLYSAYKKYKEAGQELFTCVKIEPSGTCIGGIYGIDIDLLRRSATEPIDENDRSGCVDKATNGEPITCINK